MTTTRMTTQRLKILQYLRATKDHPSAEDVHKYVAKELPTITLATVYRNLNTLADQGIIMRLKIDNAYRYDGQEGTHAHAVCASCGSIQDIEIEQELLTPLLAKNKKGFRIQDVKVTYTGTCEQCEKERRKIT